MIEDHWAHALGRLVRIEMARLDWSYADLVRALGAVGVTEETERSVRAKVNRGTFSAAFLVQAMLAMGVREVRLDGREIAAAIAAPPSEKRKLL